MAIAFRAAATLATGTATSAVINKPTGTVQGDVMLAIINTNANSLTITPPSGWASVQKISTTSAGATFEVFYKVAGASEDTSYTFNISASTRRNGIIASFSGIFNSATVIDASGQNAQTGTGSDRAYGPSITTSVANTMLVYISGYDAANSTYTWTHDTGFTEAAITSGNARSVLAYKALSSSGATGTINATNSAGVSLSLGNFSVAIKEDIPIAADVGTFSVSGNDTGTTKSSLLTAAALALSLSAGDVNFSSQPIISADTGTYTISAPDAGLSYAGKITADTGAYVLSGSNTGLTQGGGGSYILDTYTGAGAAWSVSRKLRSAYSGPAIRVRRSSDNGEQDIGFDGNGNLDESALTTFVGSGDAWTVTIYDQTVNGNNLLSGNPTDSKIVEDGVIQKENDRVVTNLNSSEGNFSANIPRNKIFGTNSTYWIISGVYDTFFYSSTSDIGLLIDPSNLFGLGAGLYFKDLGDNTPGATGNATPSNGSRFVLEGLYESSSSIKVFINGVDDSDTVSNGSYTSPYDPETFYLGYFSGGNISECIIWPSNQTSNRAGIYENVNSYYENNPGANLTAATGTFAITGSDTGLLYGRVMAAGGGTYTLTGSDAGLAYGLQVSAATGTFGLSGTDTGLLYGRVMAANSGAYAFIGSDVGLPRGLQASAETGTFAITGSDTGLLYGQAMAADGGVYAIAGADAGLIRGLQVSAATGTFGLSGTDTGLLYGRVTAADGGTYTLTGNAAGLTRNIPITADAGAYTLAGADARFSRSLVVTAEVGGFALSGNTTGLVTQGTLFAASGTYTFSGHGTDFLSVRTITADAGAFVVTGTDTGLTAARVTAADGGTYTLTGNAAGLVTQGALFAATGTFTLSGSDTIFLYGRRITADAGVYTVAGSATNLPRGRTIAANAGAYTLSGSVTGLTVTRVIAAESNTYVLYGGDATLLYGVRMTADAGAFAITGFDAELLRGRVIPADAGVYTIVESDTGVLYARIFMPGAGQFTFVGASVNLAYSSDYFLPKIVWYH